ncbi:SusC/RagA family TonB-linked outer membrane protein, partial [Parabacteroides goldsteinii]
MEKKNRSFYLVFISVFLLLGNLLAEAQTGRTISGIVVSEVGNEPLIGVNVVQKGTTNGAVTDLDGRFTLTVPDGSVLQITYIGYQEQLLTVKPNIAIYQVTLKEDSQALDEVVVVGYGIQKKKLVTGATVQVKGDDIQKLNTVSALGALQSQTPGVNITQSSGMPGEGFNVTIRGLGTTGSSGPLYIIDGVTGADINNLNPADIESIDVLKDAASAAIYGSRAANGVVLVTTKQGRAGKATISYDGYFGVQNVYKMVPTLNAQEYAMIQNEGRLMDGLPAYDFSSMVPNWESYANGTNKGTNWLDEMRNENAPVQNHALNITGGSEQSVYSIGISYTSQEGILGKPVQPKYDRYTFRLNTEHILLKNKDFDIIKFGENLTYSYTEKSGISIGNQYQNDINGALKANPFLPMYDEDGNYHYALDWDPTGENPVALMDYAHGQNLTKKHNIKANAYVTLQPIKNLKIRSSFGLTMEANSYRSFKPVYELASNVYNKENEVTQRMFINSGWLWENTVSYDFKINNNHNFSALIGQSMERSGLGDNLSASNVNSIFDDFDHAYLDNTTVIYADKTTVGGSPYMKNGILQKRGIASFFGRINYDYKETYLLTLVMRADGSSNFAKGNRWGYFPSVSAGWVMSNEAFMEPTRNYLDFLKIRASWGQNGNQDIDPFQYLATISSLKSNYFFGPDKQTISSGAYPDILPNKDVTWETSEQLDLGLDARFLGSRLGLSFDYYIKTTKDWLVQAPILDSYGTNAPYINGGDVRNKGIELALNWNDHVGDFTYGVNLNLSHNENEVTRIANSEGIIHGSPNILSEGTTEMYRAQEGYPIGYFYGYKTLGVFQSEKQIAEYTRAKLSGTAPGDLIFADTNKDGVIDDK